jgi:hypothetical protein
MAALDDRPRSGKEPTITAEAKAELAALDRGLGGLTRPSLQKRAIQPFSLIVPSGLQLPSFFRRLRDGTIALQRS